MADLSWITGAGSVLGSLIGGIGNYRAQKEANKTNLQIAQMNNDWNEEMMMRQMDYNTDMWNRQNEYNTPEAQRARLEQAGLNPYMMMSGGSAGTASSAQGISTPTAQSVSVQPAQFDTTNLVASIGHLADMIFNTPKRDAEIGKLGAETNQINTMLPYLVEFQKLNNKYRKGEVTIQTATMDNVIKRWDLENQVLEQERNYKLAQINSVKLDNQTKEIMNKYLPDFQSTQLMILGQEYANKVREGELTVAEMKYKLAQTALTYAQERNEGKKGLLLDQEANLNHQRWLDGEINRFRNKLDFKNALRVADGIVEATNAQMGYEKQLYRDLKPYTGFKGFFDTFGGPISSAGKFVVSQGKSK